MGKLFKTLLGWCLAQVGWVASAVFRLVDWCMYPDARKPKTAAAVPAQVPTPDRFDQAKAQEWGERMEWQERVYEEIDEMVPYVRKGDRRG